MTKALVRIQAQIARLQKEADAIRSREVGDVVKRIQEAIRHYALTPADLFGEAPARKAASGPAHKRAGRKPVSAAKYRDEAGNSWSGRGKRPNWFKAALAAGKSAEDLLVR